VGTGDKHSRHTQEATAIIITVEDFIMTNSSVQNPPVEEADQEWEPTTQTISCSSINRETSLNTMSISKASTILGIHRATQPGTESYHLNNTCSMGLSIHQASIMINNEKVISQF